MPDTTTTTTVRGPATEKRLATLYPPYRKQVETIMDALQKLGLGTWIVSGYRTPEEQARTYAVGRGIPGEDFTISGIKVVTPSRAEYPGVKTISDAPPFNSAHQWGLAVDFGWIVNGMQKDEPSDPAHWRNLYRIAQENIAEDITKAKPGDKGHIQSKAWHWVKANLLAYKAIYLKGGKNAVFEQLDADIKAGKVKV